MNLQKTSAPPLWVMLVGALVIVGGAIMMIYGGWIVGATWDERTHVIMLQTFFSQGWNVTPDALLPDGTPDPAFIWGVYVYGPVAEIFAHVTSAALGLELLGDPIYTAASTSGRHVGIALMGLIGVASVAVIARLITSSWRYGVLAAAVLASTPLWVGHSMFNIKDLPVASGYTLGTVGIVAVAHANFRTSRLIRWGGMAALVLGAVLASGTREAMGAPLAAAAVGVPLALYLLRLRDRETAPGVNLRDAAIRMAWAVGSLVVAYLVLVAIYPKAYANPINLAWQALVVSARFPFDEPVLTAGVWMDQPPPWTYLPLWFGAQLPLLVTVFAVVGLGVWLVLVIRRLLGSKTGGSSFVLAMTFAVVLQFAMMPLLGIILRSNMYDAQRQFLFSVSALAVLATLGIRYLSKLIAERSRNGWVRNGFWAVVAVGIVVPTVGQAFLMPYNYIYFNPVASAFGINDRWQTDYWRASSNELMRRLPEGGPEYCAFESGRKQELSPCSIEQMFEPYVPERGQLAKDGVLPPDGYWLVRENKSGTRTPDNCNSHDEITRPLWGEQVVIGQIFACAP